MSMQSVDDEESGRTRPSVRELEVLHAVITTRKTTAAAQRLGVSQPAVSRAIAALEARLNRALFVRDGGRLVPTADAFALDAEAAPIFTALARLENWPSTPQKGSVLRIATTATLAHTFLANVVARFGIAEPDTRTQVEISKSTDVIATVADGGADIGLVDSPVPHAGVRPEPFRQSIAHCLLWADHPLAEKQSLTPTDLAGQPMIMLTRRFSVRAQLERAFADHGVEPQVAAEAATTEFIAELVRARMGLAIVNPFPIAFVTDPSLVFRPFEPVISYETAFLMPATGASLPVARRFIDFVRTDGQPAG